MDQVNTLKEKGNAALKEEKFQEAIDYYTQAIALDDKNHILYSNRSAAHLKAGNFQSAINDANKTIKLKPDWGKGYSRKAAALAYRGDYQEAIPVYNEGLKYDPNNLQLKDGLEEAKGRLALSLEFSNEFMSDDIYTRLQNEPQLRKYLKDPSFIADIEEIRRTRNVGRMAEDTRLIETMLLLKGIGKNDKNNVDDKMDVDPPKPEPAKAKDNPDKNLTTEEQKAKKEKELGNEAYKKKDFETALKHYNKAVEMVPTDITYYNNIAAVYFEQKEYQKCIEQCEKAIDIGRENRADFKLIAKAFTRIGNAYKKLENWPKAKIYYEKAMSEHRTPEIKALLSDVEKRIEEAERKAYVDPAKAEEAKEKGNELFNKGEYAEAVKYYSEAIKRNPNEGKYYSNRAACYTKLAAFDLGLKDCDMCIQLEPKFIKGWIRKGKILQVMQKVNPALTAYQKALDIDPTNVEALEGYKQCLVAVNSNPEEVRKRAMGDPEVQAILCDPAMRLILEQMQNDPKALQDHLKNPDIARKIQKLLDSGLIAFH